MDQPSEIEFNVDEQYENEKGVFTVVSKDRDEMVIRWENGEETRTDIELQRRIIERRQWEEEQRAREAEAAAKSARKGSAAQENKPFNGLAAADFKNSAAKTRWRSRSQLGGSVVHQMGASGFKFNSWAFGNKPEMHIQDAGHRKRGVVEEQAKLFVAVDEGALYYGFRVDPPQKTAIADSDWGRVLEWLSIPENGTMLRSLAAEERLQVTSPETPGFGRVRASEDGWYQDSNGSQAPVETLAAHIRQVTASAPCGLQIATVVDKETAVAEGPGIAATIAQLFTRLLPLYRAAAVR